MHGSTQRTGRGWIRCLLWDNRKYVTLDADELLAVREMIMHTWDNLFNCRG